MAVIFTVIGRRNPENREREKERKWRFDLSGTYLRNADLSSVYLERIGDPFGRMLCNRRRRSPSDRERRTYRRSAGLSLWRR